MDSWTRARKLRVPNKLAQLDCFVERWAVSWDVDHMVPCRGCFGLVNTAWDIPVEVDEVVSDGRSDGAEEGSSAVFDEEDTYVLDIVLRNSVVVVVVRDGDDYLDTLDDGFLVVVR